MSYISCSDYAAQVKQHLKVLCNHSKLKLAIIQVGDNEASNRYIRGKINDCNEVGIEPCLYKYDSDISTEQLVMAIKVLNKDSNTSGIIVQLPLPKHIQVTKIINSISPSKDVDGFTPNSPFKPCTPLGIIEYLAHNQIDISGKDCVVVGRSDIVGKPMAQMLTDLNGTVTLCHSQTKDLKYFTKHADIIVSAVGKRNIITADMVKDGAIVIDVGINFDENGKLCGDCDYVNLVDKCELITPVPKGVGLLTRVELLANTYRAEMRRYCVSCNEEVDKEINKTIEENLKF